MFRNTKFGRRDKKKVLPALSIMHGYINTIEVQISLQSKEKLEPTTFLTGLG